MSQNQTDSTTSTGPQYNATTSTTTMHAVTGFGVILGFANSLISNSSAQGAWMIVNLMQLLLLLPLMANFMSNKVVNFILSNGFFTLSLSYVPLEEIDKANLIKKLDFEQPNSYISDIGMQSGSASVNYLVSFLLLLILLIVHSIVFCLHQ